MEGPVLTESEVWKVGSGTNTSLNDDRSIDYPPLMNDTVTDENLKKISENPGTMVQEENRSNVQEQPDPEVAPDQSKSVTPHDLERLEEDLFSTQTEVKSDETTESACKQERCVNQAEESKICLTSDQQDLDLEINQEITILVTNHDSTLETEDEDIGEQKTSSCPAESETVSSVKGGAPSKEESLDGSIVVASMIEVSQVQKTSVINNVSTEEHANDEKPNLPGDLTREVCKDRQNESDNATSSESQQITGSSTPQKLGTSNTDAFTETSNVKAETIGSMNVSVCGLKDQPTQPEGVEINSSLKKNESIESKDSGRLSQDTHALSIRSPGRQQHVQTQVSLEVMYQSVATSPMTPPEGSAAFLFPYPSFGKLGSKCSAEVALESIETKDAEMQVGLQVESRSVATAPMTPIILTAPEVIPEPEPRPGVQPDEVPEPVQEVSWDEKGMTWEVYGAVVEVAVLGTAIQKHLEKQVKKHKKQPSTLPTPTESSNPTETSVPSSPPPISDVSHCSPDKQQSEINKEEEAEAEAEAEAERTRRRQNPFRKWFRNVWRPSCCSRPHNGEEN